MGSGNEANSCAASFPGSSAWGLGMRLIAVQLLQPKKLQYPHIGGKELDQLSVTALIIRHSSHTDQ